MNRVREAVFGFKEAGLKLGVTPWVPRFMQSVIYICIKVETCLSDYEHQNKFQRLVGKYVPYIAHSVRMSIIKARCMRMDPST